MLIIMIINNNNVRECRAFCYHCTCLRSEAAAAAAATAGAPAQSFVMEDESENKASFDPQPLCPPCDGV